MMRTNPTNNNEQHTRESGDLEKKSGRRSDGGNMLIMIVLTVGGAGHNDHQTQAIISDINWAISRAQLCQECATMRDIARTSDWSIVTRVDNEEVFVSLALTDWNLWNVCQAGLTHDCVVLWQTWNLHF